MSSQPKPADRNEPPLDVEAAKFLEEWVRSLRTTLLSAAADVSDGKHIRADDIQQIAQRFDFSDAFRSQVSTRLRKRTAQATAKAVIEKSIRRNRPYARLAIGISITLFAVGLFLILRAAIAPQSSLQVVAQLIGGLGCGGMLLVPFRYAVEVSRHNVALDLLGPVLDQTDDGASVASALQALLKFVFPEEGAASLSSGQK